MHGERVRLARRAVRPARHTGRPQAFGTPWVATCIPRGRGIRHARRVRSPCTPSRFSSPQLSLLILNPATKTALFNGTTTLTINGWGNTSYLSQLGTGPYTLGTSSNLGAVDGGSFGDGQNRLIFTDNPGFGLGNYIAGINFDGFGPGATQVAFGSNFEIVPVPEPATTALIGAIALCALIGYRERRRFTGFGKRMAARK